MYNAELQQLRELGWFLLPRLSCHFCHLPLIAAVPNLTFGHRRHHKIKGRLTIHHLDEDRSNNAYTNLVIAHSVCHIRHHHHLNAELIDEMRGESHA